VVKFELVGEFGGIDGRESIERNEKRRGKREETYLKDQTVGNGDRNADLAKSGLVRLLCRVSIV